MYQSDVNDFSHDIKLTRYSAFMADIFICSCQKRKSRIDIPCLNPVYHKTFLCELTHFNQ